MQTRKGGKSLPKNNQQEPIIPTTPLAYSSEMHYTVLWPHRAARQSKAAMPDGKNPSSRYFSELYTQQRLNPGFKWMYLFSHGIHTVIIWYKQTVLAASHRKLNEVGFEAAACAERTLKNYKSFKGIYSKHAIDRLND